MAICSRALYRLLMDDYSSYDGLVDDALAEAQEFLEEETGRLFESGARTEVLIVSSDGYVYPAAVPITSVTAPLNSKIDGNRVLVGSYYSMNISPSDSVTLAYTGGYSAADLPRSLVRLVARLAYTILPHSSDIPEGATSITVGDVSVTLAATASGDTKLMRDVRKWDRKRVECY